MSRIMEIKKRIMELIEQKVEKADGIKILRKEFKGETSQDLVELWRLTKEENEINTKNKHTPKNTKENNTEKPSEAKKEESKSKLVPKEIKLDGEYNEYVITKEKILAGELEFKTVDDVEIYRTEQINEFMKRINEILDVMQYKEKVGM